MKQEQERKTQERLYKSQMAKAEKEKQATVRKINTDARKAVVKIAPLLSALDTAMKDDTWASLPKLVQTRVLEATTTLKDMELEAHCKATHCHPDPLTFDFNLLQAKAKEASQVLVCIKWISRSCQSL